ncbi:MAG TPA: hypothetical protein VFS24_06285 [Steroidobacteraceae bacterium]|nr:hypothetical protein [Steroidobacteraceae bacterium]
MSAEPIALLIPSRIRENESTAVPRENVTVAATTLSRALDQLRLGRDVYFRIHRHGGLLGTCNASAFDALVEMNELIRDIEQVLIYE